MGVSRSLSIDRGPNEGDRLTLVEMANRLGGMGAAARDALPQLCRTAKEENAEVARSAAEAVEKSQAALERGAPG